MDFFGQPETNTQEPPPPLVTTYRWVIVLFELSLLLFVSCSRFIFSLDQFDLSVGNLNKTYHFMGFPEFRSAFNFELQLFSVQLHSQKSRINRSN